MSKKKRRKKRRNRNKERTREEDLVFFGKSRGGRGSVRFRDKTKYNRKRDKYRSSEKSEDFSIFPLTSAMYYTILFTYIKCFFKLN